MTGPLHVALRLASRGFDSSTGNLPSRQEAN